ncbi:MAG: putative metallo-hydrolase YycJ [Candidatus Heimdallarchaeota archaeon LC_2]|nr:MAG: putative metallo-hydrolase YycJ [Candidatus Heimdallarchaeota archaeon LC_2]
MQFQSLASGSNGNCSVWDTPNGAIIFDAGISRTRIIKGLNNLDVEAKSVKYIFITHAHWDHVNGLPVLMNYLENARVVATSQTINELTKLKKNDIRYQNIANKAIPVEFDDTIELSNRFSVSCFPAEHDIAGASGFQIKHKKSDFTVSYITDTASLSLDFVDAMSHSDIFFLESNHDLELLNKSRRPYWLKQRIKSTHLSNNKFLHLAKQIISDRTKVVYLGHLSGECNDEFIVAEQMKKFTKVQPVNWVVCTRSRESAKFISTKFGFEIQGGLTNINDDRIKSDHSLASFF